MALDGARSLFRKDIEAQGIEEQEELRVARSGQRERPRERVALDHMREILGSPQPAHDAAGLQGVIETGERGERSVSLDELDDLGRVMDVGGGEVRIEI